MTPVSSIVFTSSQIPVIPNQYSNPQTYMNNQLVQLQQQGGSFALVISDFSSDGTAYKPTILYIPTAEYRCINMKSHKSLNNLDIQVWWRSKLGSLIPFYLGSGGSFSMKMLFRKKKLFN